MKLGASEAGRVSVRVSALCSDSEYPVFSHLIDWAGTANECYDCDLVTRSADLCDGDLRFFVSSHEYVQPAVPSSYGHALVVQDSDLPRDRGLSPHTWHIVEGRRNIVVSLLEAAVSIDTGAIWAQRTVSHAGHELYDEINATLFRVEFAMMDFVIEKHGRICAVRHVEAGGT